MRAGVPKEDGKVENVAHRRGAERVDRLGVVADHGDALAVRLHRSQDRCLQAVGVLVFVDQHMVEFLAHVPADGGFRSGVRPVEKQVVVVEHRMALLRLHVAPEEQPQLVLPLGAPGEGRREHLLERQLGIHRARIDLQAGALGRKTLLGPREAKLVADEVHEVGGILAIMNGEGRADPDPLGIFAQQPRADAVEGPGPGQRRARGGRAEARHRSDDPLDTPRHFRRRPAREGHQQDATRVGAVDDQIGDAMRKGVGLAGARAGDDEQRRALLALPRGIGRREPLVRVQRVEPGGVHAANQTRGRVLQNHVSRFVRKRTWPFASGMIERREVD